ncbi:hypothetical protein AAG747_12865 [Rapidithrix thailandica]|uniref:Uncharacterized protein n=1 Tax=Rapidithrix thailandica TaxID=413964 RepID=A0AAW9S8P6_9BACT
MKRSRLRMKGICLFITLFLSLMAYGQESKKTYHEVGYMDRYEALPTMEFTDATKAEFDQAKPAVKSKLPEVELTESHFFIKTKGDKIKFENYHYDATAEGHRGSEFVGYYPESSMYVVIHYFTSESLGFGQLVMVDSLTNNQYEIISIGDGAVELPISSPGNDFLVYYYNYMYEQKECFMGVIKVDESNKNHPQKYLTEYSSYPSTDWAVEEIRWADNDTLIIKVYEKEFEKEEWVKKYWYVKSSFPSP